MNNGAILLNPHVNPTATSTTPAVPIATDEAEAEATDDSDDDESSEYTLSEYDTHSQEVYDTMSEESESDSSDPDTEAQESGSDNEPEPVLSDSDTDETEQPASDLHPPEDSNSDMEEHDDDSESDNARDEPHVSAHTPAPSHPQEASPVAAVQDLEAPQPQPLNPNVSGDLDKCEVRPSQIPQAGLGLFATTHIAKGARITKYSGRLITMEETMNSTSAYILYINKNFCLDASGDGHMVGKYINDGSKSGLPVNVRFGASLRYYYICRVG